MLGEVNGRECEYLVGQFLQGEFVLLLKDLCEQVVYVFLALFNLGIPCKDTWWDLGAFRCFVLLPGFRLFSWRCWFSVWGFAWSWRWPWVVPKTPWFFRGPPVPPWFYFAALRFQWWSSRRLGRWSDRTRDGSSSGCRSIYSWSCSGSENKCWDRVKYSRKSPKPFFPTANSFLQFSPVWNPQRRW